MHTLRLTRIWHHLSPISFPLAVPSPICSPRVHARCVSSSITPSHSRPNVVVVGSGVMGLSTAYQLLRNGFGVTLIGESLERTTSHAAGASIVSSSAAHEDEQPRFLRWGRETSTFLAELRLKLGSETSGVNIVSGYEFWSNRIPWPYWSDMMLGMRDVDQEEIQIVLGKEEAQQYKYAWHYTTLNVDTSVYMSWLLAEIKRLGGNLLQGRISSLAALRCAATAVNRDSHSTNNFPLPHPILDALSSRPHSCVVNCTGLAARHLVPDATVIPCKGIVLRVKNCPGLLHHAYGSELRDSYTIPRLKDTTVGGSFVYGSESMDVPAGEVARLLAEARRFVPDIPANISESDLEVWVGHRPIRSRVRLELIHGAEPPTAFPEPIVLESSTAHSYSLVDQAYVDRLKENEQQRINTKSADETAWDSSSSLKVPIIHNYGHGGSGITLHMGCAKEVVELVRNLVPLKPTS